MPNDKPEKIQRARRLLDESDRVQGVAVADATSRVREAFRMLDGYLKENPESPHKDYIERIKTTSARSLLLHLPDIEAENPDVSQWFLITFTLWVIRDTVFGVLKNRPELLRVKESFVNYNGYLEAPGPGEAIKALMSTLP